MHRLHYHDICSSEYCAYVDIPEINREVHEHAQFWRESTREESGEPTEESRIKIQGRHRNGEGGRGRLLFDPGSERRPQQAGSRNKTREDNRTAMFYMHTKPNQAESVLCMCIRFSIVQRQIGRSVVPLVTLKVQCSWHYSCTAVFVFQLVRRCGGWHGVRYIGRVDVDELHA